VPRQEAEESPVRAGFSVPKKKFRSSVNRHRIRRLVVESWRLNKHLLYPAIPDDKQLHLFFIFTDIKMPEYETVRAAVVKGIGKLSLTPALSGGEGDGPTDKV
jgi:ribonuclease P protein component